MAYIGQAPFQEFTSVPTKDNFTGDGSTTAFDLSAAVPVGSENALEVFVNNVRQEPGSGKAFTLGQDGNGDYKRITFASAPTDGHAMYVINDRTSFTSIAPLPQDLNGSELILDADADTSITASTDDQIDFKISGADDFTFTANAFNVLTGSHATFADSCNAKFGTSNDMLIYHDGSNSYIKNAVGALKIATETSGIVLTLGHTTSETTVSDNLTVTGTSTLTGGVVGNVTATGTVEPAGDTSASDNAAIGYTAAEGLILTGQGSTNDITIKNDADAAVISIPTGTTGVTLAGTLGSGAITSTGNVIGVAGTFSGVLTGTTVEATADTSASDNAAMGYTSAEGLILTGQGSTNDITIKNDADAAVISIPTGTTGVTLAGTLGSGAITSTGTVTTTGLVIGSTAVTTTPAELNLIDGGTSRGTTAVASGDGILINDGGTMAMTNVDTVSTYFASHSVGGGNIVTVGALNAGSITSGFTSIDVGAGAITTTGAVTGGSLTVDDVAVNGKVITMTGSAGDTFTTTVATNGATTLTTVDTAAAAANITITADGTAELAGTTVTLNSAGGVTLDADNGTITFADAGSSLGTITSSGYSGTAALATTVTVTDNESTDENNVITFVAGAAAAGGNVGLESDGNLTYNPSTGTLNATNISVTGTQTIVNSVTMNASNAVIFEGSTADGYETTLTVVDPTADRTITMPNISGTIPLLAVASNTAITSTPAELNYSDGVTSAIQTQFNAIIANDWVTAARIADNAIDSDMYVDGSIDLAHMSANSVDSDQYVDASIDTAHIGNLQITTGLIAADAVTSAKIADDSIDSEHYVDGSIDNAHIADNAIDSEHYADGSIDNAHIADDAIDSEHYAAGSIDTAHIAADNITSALIADDQIDSEHYVDGSIDTAHIGDLQVTGAKIALDHRSAGATDDVKTGNQNDYLFFDADVGISFFTANAEDMRLEDDGDLHVDNDVIAFSTTISDATLKYNINPVEFALDKIKQLKGVTFNYFKNDKESAGLLAQDVEKVLPSAVSEKKLPLHTGDDKAYKTLHYDSVTAILVEAIKELTAKVEKLENK